MTAPNPDRAGETRLRLPLVIGGLAGFAVGAVLAVLALAVGKVDIESTQLGMRVLAFLLAIPPFLFTPILSSSAGALFVLLIWWVFVGAFMGWCVGRHTISHWAVAAIMLAAVVVGHVLALRAIDRELGAIASAIRAMFGG